LAIELSGEVSTWKYAINRVSAAELHARLDQKEVWSCKAGSDATSRSAYFLFFRPMPRELAD
jgi:hypothetical protein